MYDSILIPTDGRSEIDSAVTRGLDLARVTNATLHTLYVTDTRDIPEEIGAAGAPNERPESEKVGRNATNTIADRATALDLTTHREHRTGVPHREIIDYAHESGIELIVMGTHEGRENDPSGRNNTTERVVQAAKTPVMAVPSSAPAQLPEARHRMYNTIVVPTDGSDAAERASQTAIQLAERYGAKLHVVYVVDPTAFDFVESGRSVIGLLKEGGQTAIDTIASTAEARNLPVSTAMLRGVPEEAIRNYAAGVSADLIVMGKQGRVGAQEQLLGSTTARVIERSTIPILTVS